MKTVGIRLYDWLCDEIERVARVLGLPMAEIVRRRLLQGHPPEPIADLLGSVKGLPPDLSHNVDKYVGRALRKHARRALRYS